MVEFSVELSKPSHLTLLTQFNVKNQYNLLIS